MQLAAHRSDAKKLHENICPSSRKNSPTITTKA